METDTCLVKLLDETEKAYKLKDMEDPDREYAWFPKSQIHFERRNAQTGEALAVIPLWLLKDKGWNS